MKHLYSITAVQQTGDYQAACWQDFDGQKPQNAPGTKALIRPINGHPQRLSFAVGLQLRRNAKLETIPRFLCH
jgi:hypothetical protein